MASLMSRFWWIHKSNDTKIQWRKWSKIGESKSNGGLGFRDIVAFNRNLLSKQFWRLLQQPNSLISQIMPKKYYKDGKFWKLIVELDHP